MKGEPHMEECSQHIIKSDIHNRNLLEKSKQSVSVLLKYKERIKEKVPQVDTVN